MLIVATTITAVACTDPEIVPATVKGTGTTSSQIGTREFRTTVTTWSRPDGSNYVGLVQSIPEFDLSKSRIVAVGNGRTIKVDTFLDVTKVKNPGATEDYFWASTFNNVLVLNFVGQTPSSLPPFPLDVIIVY